jgi:hypothetical protein
MKEEKVYFQNSEGLNLCGIFTYSKNPTKTCIVLCHGMTVDKDEGGIFTNLARKLVQEGFTVFRFDFRGHGESEGKSIDMTIAGEKEDLSSTIEFLKSKGYEKFGILAASFGGGASTLYVAEHQDIIKTFVLWNPIIDYHSILKPELPWPKKYFNEKAMEKLEKQGYIEIGSLHFKAGKKLFEEMKILKLWEKIKDIKIPILFVHGNKDTYVPYEDSVKYSKLVNAKLETIEGAEHGFHDGKEGKIADKKTIGWFNKYLK